MQFHYPQMMLKEIKQVRFSKGKERTVQAQSARGLNHHDRDTSGQKSFLPLVAGSSVESVKSEVYGRPDEDITLAFDKIEKFTPNHLKSKTVYKVGWNTFTGFSAKALHSHAQRFCNFAAMLGANLEFILN